MPMMKARNSTAEKQSGSPGQQAEDQADADHDLEHRQQVTDRRNDHLGEQVIGPDRAHTRSRVGQLQRPGHDPHPAGDETRHQTHPLLHYPSVRVLSLI